MKKTGYYTHLDGQRYRCEVVEETETMRRVRLSEELWLPRHTVKIEGR